MAPKRATFLTYGTDERCSDTRKFIEDSGVLLSVRDISKTPLSEDEIKRMVGHLDIRHFLNEMSEAFSKLNLDPKTHDREAIIKLMAADHTLIKRPIIRTSRLTTVGCDKKKISDMLLINSNGKAAELQTSRGAKTNYRGSKQEAATN